MRSYTTGDTVVYTGEYIRYEDIVWTVVGFEFPYVIVSEQSDESLRSPQDNYYLPPEDFKNLTNYPLPFEVS